MRKVFKLLVLMFLCVFWSWSSYGSHAAGGELLYEHISGNQYNFKFKFYRDCSGINAPFSLLMCYKNSCNVTSPQSIYLQRTSGPILVNGDCPNNATNCNSPNGLPSYQEYIYEGVVTLSETCNSWKFWVNHNARNPMNFLSGTNLFVETSFNNALATTDNSPTFNRLPVPYCCVNVPFVYDNSASDVDGDSLVYESIMPRTHPTFNSCATTAPQLCTYPPFSPALNFINNPLPCNNTFVVNPVSGLFSMTPNLQGKGVIAIKVSQYRNGQLLGYIVRDIQTIVMACNILAPVLAIDTNSFINCQKDNDTIRACAGKNFTFCFKTTSNDATSLISVQSNITTFSMPSSLIHNNANSDSVYSCFNWSPSNSDTGWHFLHVFVSDSICRPIGVQNTDTFSKQFPIYISPRGNSVIHDTVCEPASVMGYNQSGMYVDTFINQLGCDSICTLYLTVLSKSYTTEHQTICAPATYWGYAQTGMYVDTFVNNNGCDSIRTLHLTVLIKSDTTISQTICSPNSFLGYSHTGTYVDTFINQLGCDSIRTIQLTVLQQSYSSYQQIICSPNSYWGYTASGVYNDTFVNAVGCDSIRTLSLIVNPIIQTIFNHTICSPNTFAGYSQSGTYIDSFITMNGCDSIRTLHLVILPRPDTLIVQTICDPNTFLGYSQSGTYVDTLMAANGCDSFRTLLLTVLPRTFSSINQTICEPNSYLGYNQTGIFTDTFINAAGCDSFRTLNLVVHPIKNTSSSITICEPGVFLGYSQSGIYVDTFASSNGCDSIHSLHLTVLPISTLIIDTTVCYPANIFGYSATGTYYDTLTNAQGCELHRILNLEVQQPYFYDTTVILCQGEKYYCNGAYQGTAGIFYDSLQSTMGCDSIIRTTLKIIDIPNPFLGMDEEICEGETIRLTPGGFDHYLWNDGDTSEVKFVSDAGEYIVQVWNNNKHCVKNDTVGIHILPSPDVSITILDDPPCLGSYITIVGSGAKNYAWYVANSLEPIGSKDSVHIFAGTEERIIRLVGWDTETCRDSVSANLLAEDCCGKIIVPNAFTPNGDGLNDNFGLISNPQIENLDFKIFNRWGQCIFKTYSLDSKWDGTYKGEYCEMGTYFYIIKAKCYTQDTPKIYQGDINLIR